VSTTRRCKKGAIKDAVVGIAFAANEKDPITIVGAGGDGGERRVAVQNLVLGQYGTLLDAFPELSGNAAAGHIDDVVDVFLRSKVRVVGLLEVAQASALVDGRAEGEGRDQAAATGTARLPVQRAPPPSLSGRPRSTTG
jgi:hypothetical protein